VLEVQKQEPRPAAAQRKHDLEREESTAEPSEPTPADAQAGSETDAIEEASTEASGAQPPDDALDDSPGARSPLRWAMFVGGEAVFRAFPKTAGALIVGGALGLRHFWLEPRLGLLPGVDQELSRNVVASYSSLRGALAGCAGMPLSIVRASACLGFDIAALSAESSGATEPGSKTAALYSSSATLAFVLPAGGWLSVRVHGQLLLALHEPSFVIEGLGEAHRVPPLSLALGAALRFAP
jgi:hypothetical protein